MYRVINNSRGKYGNVIPGTRYCLTKRSALRITTWMVEEECNPTVEKWYHLHGDVFCWGRIGADGAFWDKVYKNVKKE